MKVLTEAPIFYNADGEPQTKFGKFIQGAGKVTTGLQSALPYVAQISQRQRTDVKQACGRRPLFGARKQAWDKCAQSFYNRQGGEPAVAPAPEQTSGSNNTIYYVVGGIALVGILIFALKR